MEDIKVSVICTTYNHEKYIRNALEGFVNQKTNFKYEVLINDDCSTDNTAKIIKEYELKYPEIIKPIYQTENQYSKGVRIIKNILMPLTKGKYLAICEGDDCWIENEKLQRQFDYLESHPECFLYSGGCAVYDFRKNKQFENVIVNQEKDFVFEDIITNNYPFNTCTFFMRREVIENMPNCFYVPNVGDIQITYYAGILGYVHYDPRIIGKYNYFVPGSWSERNNSKVKTRKTNWINMLNNLNEFYNYKYDSCIKNAIRETECELLLYKEDYKTIYKKYKDIYKKYNRKAKIKVLIGCIFPNIINIAIKIKRKIFK